MEQAGQVTWATKKWTGKPPDVPPCPVEGVVLL